MTTILADSDLIETIKAYDARVPSLDIWSASVHRGKTFGKLFKDFKKVSAKPFAILEYGIDAYDHQNKDEYENIGKPYQAHYAESLWEEITKNSDVCIGGSIMAFSDDWWRGKYSTGKHCPESDPSVHGTCGYPVSSSPDEYFDQEWAGIARVLPNASRRDIVEPRAAYYRLQALWTGTEAQISVNPLTIDFGDVLLNSASEPKSITITNTGNRDLIIRSLKVLGGETEFEITPGTCESLKPMIPARSSCNVTAVFIPDSAGKETATLKIISNDHESPRTEVILKGTGVQARKYRISGGGFNDPQDAKREATFSMDVTGPSNLSGSLRYYYAKNRLELVSTEITSVSISNNTAIIPGKGKVNGVAGYVFTATIVDGSPDKFGLSINKLNGTPFNQSPQRL